MASSNDASQLQADLQKHMPNNLANLIDKLSGDRGNLRVDLQQVKFCVGKQKFEVDGTVNFNVIHKTPNAPVKREEAP